MENLDAYLDNNSENNDPLYTLEADQYSEYEENRADIERSQENCLHTLKFDVVVRKFKTQTSAPTVETINVSFDSITEFHQNIWQSVVKYIKKEVIIESPDAEPYFSTTDPIVDDFEKFILFYDTSCKKVVRSEVTLNVITHWKKKKMKIYVHPYSTSLANNEIFKFVSKRLLEPFDKDRSGACTNSQIDTIMARLRTINPSRYLAQDINWRLWATFISNSEPHLQEELINSPPPPELIRNFREYPNRSDTVLSSNTENLTVGLHINNEVLTELALMKPGIERIKTNAENHLNDVNELYNRFQSLCVKTQARADLLDAIPRQLPTRETESSAAILEGLDDCEDVDHI